VKVKVGFLYSTTYLVDKVCSVGLVNFGPLAAEVGLGVCAPQLISTGFTSWQGYCTAV